MLGIDAMHALGRLPVALRCSQSVYYVNALDN
jgi:hypothetical protein